MLMSKFFSILFPSEKVHNHSQEWSLIAYFTSSSAKHFLQKDSKDENRKQKTVKIKALDAKYRLGPREDNSGDFCCKRKFAGDL